MEHYDTHGVDACVDADVDVMWTLCSRRDNARPLEVASIKINEIRFNMTHHL